MAIARARGQRYGKRMAQTEHQPPARPSWLKLGVAVLAAPVTLAAALTLLAFLIAGSTEPDLVTRRAAVVFSVSLGAFSLTFGLAGALALSALGQRGVLAWLGTGAGAGLLVALGTGIFREGVPPFHIAVAVILGLMLFALIRLFAGVRTG